MVLSLSHSLCYPWLPENKSCPSYYLCAWPHTQVKHTDHSTHDTKWLSFESLKWLTYMRLHLNTSWSVTCCDYVWQHAQYGCLYLLFCVLYVYSCDVFLTHTLMLLLLFESEFDRHSVSSCKKVRSSFLDGVCFLGRRGGLLGLLMETGCHSKPRRKQQQQQQMAGAKSGQTMTVQSLWTCERVSGCALCVWRLLCRCVWYLHSVTFCIVTMVSS